MNPINLSDRFLIPKIKEICFEEPNNSINGFLKRELYNRILCVCLIVFKSLECGFNLLQGIKVTLFKGIKISKYQKVDARDFFEESKNCFIAIFNKALFGIVSPKYSFPNNPLAVTYTLSCGRFGDHMVAYMRAKWIAYKYKMTLLYTPFDRSKELLVDIVETPLNERFIKQYKHYLETPTTHDFQNLNQKMPVETTLFVARFYCVQDQELKMCKDEAFNERFFPIDWEDRGFRAELKKAIKPLNPIKEIHLSPTNFNVALHVRMGGGYDTHQSCITYPCKLPPEDYYTDQIKKVRELYPSSSLYIHLFTDDPEPLKLIEKYKSKLGPLAENIHFGCREKDNRHDTNVIEDFFAMSKFDCLIRPASNLSFAARVLGNFECEIVPSHYNRTETHVEVDEVTIIKKKEKWSEKVSYIRQV